MSLVADLNTDPAVPKTVNDLEVPQWETAAGQATPVAPRLGNFTSDVLRAPAPPTKGFPEQVVLDPNLITSTLDAIGKAPDVGFGVFDHLGFGLPSKIAGAVGGALSPLIPEPVRQFGDAAVGKFNQLTQDAIGLYAKRIGNVFNPSDKPRSLLGDEDHLTFFGGKNLGEDVTDAAKMVAAALFLLKSPGAISTALRAARLGTVADAAGGFTGAFKNTLGAAKTAETTAAAFGRFAGLATLGTTGVGAAAEFALPKVAGNEQWAQDILKTRIVPDDSPWRFPFEIATTLPLDLPSMLAAGKDSRITGAAATQLFGPGRNPVSHIWPEWRTAIDRGVLTTADVNDFNKHSVQQYAKKTLLDDFKNRQAATLTEVGQLPYVQDVAKSLGISEQEAANKLISDRVTELYRDMGTNDLHRAAANWARDEYHGWAGLDTASQMGQWQEYRNTVLPLEQQFPDMVLSINDAKQFMQRDAATAWLNEAPTFGLTDRARFAEDFPSFKDMASKVKTKDELLQKLNDLPVPEGAPRTSDVGRLGALRNRLERTNAAILAGDTSLRAERAAILGDMKSIRDSAVEYHANQLTTLEAQLARREREFWTTHGASLSDRVTMSQEMDAVRAAIRDTNAAMHEASLAGTRWQLEHYSTGPRMRLVDDLGVRSSAKERTTAGRVWDRLFGALPNKDLGLRAEKYLYEEAGRRGATPTQVERFMALASDFLETTSHNSVFGFSRQQYTSIYSLPPGELDVLARKAGIPEAKKAWSEAIYRAYPGALKLLQEGLTGGKAIDIPYSRNMHYISRSLYPMFRFYFSPRFVLINLQERNILGTSAGGPGYHGPADPRLERMNTSAGLKTEAAANTGYVNVDALPSELARLTGQLSPEFAARRVALALREAPEMADVLKAHGVDPRNINSVMKYLNDVTAERMKALTFDVPLTSAEQTVKARIDELAAQIGDQGAGADLATLHEHEKLSQELTASIVKRQVRGETADLNKVARAATDNPGAATNEALATAQGREFAPKTGAALKLSADEVGKAYSNAKLAFEDTVKGGGATRNVMTGESPTKGFGVSVYKDRELVIDGRPMTEQDARAYVRKNLDLLSQPGNNFGTWTDKATGKTYLDVSVLKSSREEAIRLAQDNGQLAVWDYARSEDIPVPGRSQATSGPAATNGGPDGGAGNAVPSRSDRVRVTAALENAVSRAEFEARDSARRIFLGNPDRSALERGLNSYLLYWPISYQLKVGRTLFEFLTGKAFNMPTGTAPAMAWSRLYQEVQQRQKDDPEVAKWFKDHKAALYLFQQLLPITPDSVGVTLSPFTRLAGSAVGLGSDSTKKLFDRVTSQGLGYDAKMAWQTGQEFAKTLKGN